PGACGAPHACQHGAPQLPRRFRVAAFPPLYGRYRQGESTPAHRAPQLGGRGIHSSGRRDVGVLSELPTWIRRASSSSRAPDARFGLAAALIAATASATAGEAVTELKSGHHARVRLLLVCDVTHNSRGDAALSDSGP